MKKIAVMLILALGNDVAYTNPQTAFAQAEGVDAIKVLASGGNASTQVTGKITAHTATEVTIQSRATGVKIIPANEIEFVRFSNGGEISLARTKIRDGKLDEAQNDLKSVKRDKLDNPAAQVEYDYVQALLAIRLAQGQSGNLTDAGKLLYAFINANKENYNYYPACELMGDVFVSIGKPAPAEQMFAELAKAPWPEYKMRASIASGRSLLSQNKPKEAIDKFTEAMNLSQTGAKGSETQVMTATLGKAEALALSGKGAEGLKIAEEVLAKASAEDVDLHARIYNTLGSCYQKTNREKDALLAYLHVHLLYANLADADAESLANLATLWEKQGRPDRANECRGQLQSKYPNSRWAAKKAS